MQKYVNLRGHEVFTFQWSKRGEALVILHGGLSHSEKVKKYLLPAVKKNFKVLPTIEQAMATPQIKKAASTLIFKQKSSSHS